MKKEKTRTVKIDGQKMEVKIGGEARESLIDIAIAMLKHGSGKYVDGLTTIKISQCRDGKGADIYTERDPDNWTSDNDSAFLHFIPYYGDVK